MLPSVFSWVLLVLPLSARSYEEKILTATSVQRMSAVVDAALSMATSTEQLVAMERSLPEDPDVPEELMKSLRALTLLNLELQQRLITLNSELGTLFTTGQSNKLLEILRTLAELPASQEEELRNALAEVPKWTQHCQNSDISALYSNFVTMRRQHRRLDEDVRALTIKIAPVRERRTAVDGELAGVEERLGVTRGRRSGEEYEVARYLGSNLFKWNLLRTKVAHELAHGFNEAKEAALQGPAVSTSDKEALEQHLNSLEIELQTLVDKHSGLSKEKRTVGGQLRSFLKSMLIACEDLPSKAAISKRFKVLKSGPGVIVQATEEMANFLNNTATRSLSAMVKLLEDVLSPYKEGDGDGLRLPNTWKAKPRIGAWWEWLKDGEAGLGKPVSQNEFERRFKAAKRRFSVHVSNSEPITMAYLMWLIMEETLSSPDADADAREVLALPSPSDAAPAPVAPETSVTV